MLLSIALLVRPGNVLENVGEKVTTAELTKGE